ncbi:MAG: hypothetical protein AAF750_05240 [Planctomycetota bacterium]
MNDTSIAGTPAGEARRLAMMATAGSGAVTLIYWGLWEWTGLLTMGAAMTIGMAVTAGIAAAWAELAFGESDDQHNRPSRMAILASSLGTWAALLGAVVALVRLVKGLFSSVPLEHTDWAFWLSLLPMLMAIALAVFVIKDKGYFESTRAKGITAFPLVLAGSGVAVVFVMGLTHFRAMGWFDAVGGALLAWGGLGVLWAGLWRQFNRLTGLDAAPPASSPAPAPPANTEPTPALDPADLRQPPPTEPPPAAPHPLESYPSDAEDLSPIELADGPDTPSDETDPGDPKKPAAGQA